MKIIITGAKGILGKQIYNDLQSQGMELIELDLALGHNLTDEKFVSETMRHTKADVLINCFAINDHISQSRKSTSFLDFPIEKFKSTMEVNVVALFSVCREFIRFNDGGIIINFSSIYGFKSPRPSFYGGQDKDPAYGPSKAAVSNLTKYLALHAPKFRINCVVPGGVENNQDDEFKIKYCKDLPTGRLMKRSEISGIIRFLISDDSSYCTGSDFFIDGGWNAR
jgi:NAD(P)-dependent dehydrogenase (short-subunit alcohol dehydrogenase family)